MKFLISSPSSFIFGIIFIISILASSGMASTYYLQATGINEYDSSQNHEDFYQSSIQFNEYCTKTKSLCENYINTTEDLMPVSVRSINKIESSGKPTRSLVLRRISDLIKKAKGNDQIVISLRNHGGPGDGNKNTSCIYLTSEEKICDGDIQPLLKNLKPGVKIAIIADGCFSGGFAKLASSQVCVAATADQNLVGYGPGPKEKDDISKSELWEMLLYKKIKKFSDISSLRQGDSDIRLRAGSDMMRINACAEVIEKISSKLLSKFSLSFADHVSKKISGEVNTCIATPSSQVSIYSLSSLKTSIEAVDKLSDEVILKEICGGNSAGEFREICEGWKSILKEVDNREVLEAQVKYDASKKRLLKALDLNVDLPPKQLMEFQEEVLFKASQNLINLDEEWYRSNWFDFAKSNKNVDKRAREIYSAYHEFYSSQGYLKYKKDTQVTAMRKQNKKHNQFLKDCVLRGYEVYSYRKALNDSFGHPTYQRLHFTNQNSEEAKKCENTFQF